MIEGREQHSGVLVVDWQNYGSHGPKAGSHQRWIDLAEEDVVEIRVHDEGVGVVRGPDCPYIVFYPWHTVLQVQTDILTEEDE